MEIELRTDGEGSRDVDRLLKRLKDLNLPNRLRAITDSYRSCSVVLEDHNWGMGWSQSEYSNFLGKNGVRFWAIGKDDFTEVGMEEVEEC